MVMPPCVARSLALFLPLILASSVQAAGRVYERNVQAPMEVVYEAAMLELEDRGFAVVAELNIGASLAKKAWRWGDNYNRNRYTEVRSMVLCHPEQANEVLNRTPAMMAMCPVSLTVLYKEGTTTLLFDRPAYGVSAEDGAHGALSQLESDFIAALDAAASTEY